MDRHNRRHIKTHTHTDTHINSFTCGSQLQYNKKNNHNNDYFKKYLS